MIALHAPYVPDGDEARKWAEEELSQPRYAEAKATWFDNLARDIGDFIGSLFSRDAGTAGGGWALVIVVLVVLAVLVVALVLWGRPRSARRLPRHHDDLLGDRDDRTAAQLRSDAERAARAGEWDAAVVLRYRALARGLLERDVIDPAPGATAQAIAREASAMFPEESAALREAAARFDDVRYLGRTATEDHYRMLAATDDRLKTVPLQAVSA